MTGSAHIIRADARSLPLADDSVDLVVTSPPYFALRSYQDGGEHYAGQIGAESTPREFVEALLEVTRECVRVLKPSGSMFVNLDDKYATSVGQGNGIPGATSSLHGRDRLVRAYDVTDGTKTAQMAPGVRAKSMIAVPWRYAIACIDEVGLILRGDIVWNKVNGLPESVTDRVRHSHEYWFHLTQRGKYFSAIDEIRETYDGDRAFSRRMKRADHHAKYAQANEWTSENPLGRVPGSVWDVPSEPLALPEWLGVQHYAAFPTHWPRQLIQAFSPSGICVECGEGRRPIVETSEAYRRFRAETGDYNSDRYVPGEGYAEGARKTNHNASKVPDADRRIVGHACSCTPYTEHPGTGESGPSHADGVESGAYTSTTHLGGSYQNRPRVGPWREYHWSDWDAPETRPAVVLDPFGGTGTTALVAKAYGRHGISVDMSADYCRVAEWRTNDPGELAKARKMPKPPKQLDGQLGFEFEELGA